MKIFDKIPFMGESREKKTLMEVRKHIETTYKVVEELDSMLDAFEKGDYELVKEKQNNVGSLESEADKLRRGIEEDLYSGAFLPISRSRILDFAENVDEIADTAEDASELLIFLGEDEISKELLALLRNETRTALDSVGLLIECVDNIEDLERVRGIIKKIRVKEHESDNIDHQAYGLLYGEERSPRVLHILSKLVDFIGSISDKAEDASDSLYLIVIMHKA